MASITRVPPEILVLVFEWTQSHKELLKYALVCRSWSEWAIDVGWRTSDVPLSEVLKILHIEENSDVPRRAVNDADWDKFITVSNKLTRLKPNLVLVPAAVAYFERCRNQHINDLPFQSVRKLIIHMGDTDFRTVSTACSIAPVKSILMHIAMDDGIPSHPDWLYQAPPAPSLAQSCPEVEEISVDYPFRRGVPTLSAFTRLRVFHCQTFSTHPGWWRDLPNCSNLVELWFWETEAFEYEPPWPEVSVFPKLEKFHYYTSDTSVSGEVLRMTTTWLFPSLRQLSLSPCPRPNLLERITPHLRQNSPYLRDFQLGADYEAKE